MMKGTWFPFWPSSLFVFWMGFIVHFGGTKQANKLTKTLLFRIRLSCASNSPLTSCFYGVLIFFTLSSSSSCEI